jgi:hypothetical protein
MSEIKGARKNFKKWRSRNASDTPKSSSAKDKVNKPFVLPLTRQAGLGEKTPWILKQSTSIQYFPTIEPDAYDMDSLHERVAKMKSKLYFGACKNREKSTQLMKLDHPKLYSFIKLHLSHDTLSAVMMSEHFDADKDINDPLKLWLAVKATHRPGSDAVDKKQPQGGYNEHSTFLQA